MARGRLYKKRIARLLAILLIFCQSFMLTGCLLGSVDPVLETAPKIGEGASINAVVDEARRRRQSQSLSHDMARFSVSGQNAFYILPGLENDPMDILCFDLLDYNSRGEFVYHYITPAWISKEEVLSYATDEDKKEGTVRKEGFEAPERGDFSRVDAEILMAYNPDNGHYRVLDSRAYELEWDPEYEDRPKFMAANVTLGVKDPELRFVEDEDAEKRLVSMEQRGYAGKIPGKEQYFILDMNCTGTVYDSEGNTVFAMSYATDLDFYRRSLKPKVIADRDDPNYQNRLADPEADKEKLEAIGVDDKPKAAFGSSTVVNLIMKDVAMSRDYHAFISCSAYTGATPFEPTSWLGGITFVAYRQDMARDKKLSDYISYNTNAGDQINKWMSLNGRYFPSKSDMESSDGYSMDSLKMEGDIKDSFTPFIYDISFNAALAVDKKKSWTDTGDIIIGLKDFRSMNVSGFTEEEIQNIASDPDLSDDDREQLIWYLKEYNSEDDSDSGSIWTFFNAVGLSTAAKDKIYDYWKNRATIAGKRAFRRVQALAFNNLLKGDGTEETDIPMLLERLYDYGMIPAMGPWDGKWNYHPLAFEARTPESFHVMRISTQSGKKSALVTPIDTAEASADPNGSMSMDFDHVSVYPLDYISELKRTVWYKDEGEAENLRERYVFEHPEHREDMNELVSAINGGSKDKEIRLIEDLYALLRAEDTGETGSEVKAELDELKKAEGSFEDRLKESLDHAKRQNDSGQLSDEEYSAFRESVEKAEKEYADAGEDRKKEIEDALFSASIAKSVYDNTAAAKEPEKDIGELVSRFPITDQEYVLSIAAGYVSIENVVEENRIPLSYAMAFPEGAGTVANRDLQQKDVKDGVLTAVYEGVLVSYDDSTGASEYSNIYGFTDAGRTFMENNNTPGAPYEIAEFSSGEGKNARRYLAYRTGYGVRFFGRIESVSGSSYSPLEFSSVTKEVEEYFEVGRSGLTGTGSASGTENSGSNGGTQTARTGGASDTEKSGNTGGTADTAEKQRYKSEDLKGFLPFEYLLNSSGYTRDTENRTEKAVNELLNVDTESENHADVERESRNRRFNGALATADAFGLIGADTAMVCGLNSGTAYLNLKSGETTVGEDKGSYFRIFRERESGKFKLIGFDNTAYSYQAYDLPMAKVYEREYAVDDIGTDKALIEAFNDTLKRMARDYLYRQFRTDINEKGEVYIIDMPDSEKDENAVAERLFNAESGDEESGSFRSALRELEEQRGISGDPEEIYNYLLYLRKQAAAQKPAITRTYMIAGATKLATSEKRNEPYFKNLDSRITMAMTEDELMDRLVEIRMHPEAASSISADQVEKYNGYREILDYSAEQGEISLNRIIVNWDDSSDMEKAAGIKDEAESAGSGSSAGSVSANSGTAAMENIRKKAEYRQDVLSDIREDFERLYPNEDFDSAVSDLLNKVNPENLILEKEGRADDFIKLINHGKSVLTGDPYESMAKRIKEKLPDIESVWELEELIISEKVLQPGYEGLREGFEKHVDDSAGLETAERAVALRRSDAYKEIIGDLKGDSAVKGVLSGARETWEDYLKDIILNAGAGYVKNENGLIEGSSYNEDIEKWRNLGETDGTAEPPSQ